MTSSVAWARTEASCGSGREPQWLPLGAGPPQDLGVTVPGFALGVGLGAGAGARVVGGFGFDELSPPPQETIEKAPTTHSTNATGRVILITRSSNESTGYAKNPL